VTAVGEPAGLRVLLLAPQPFYAERGTPMNVLRMCRVLCGAGHRVDLLTYPFGSEVEIPGLRVLRVARPPGVSGVPIGFSGRKVVLDLLMGLRLAALAARGRYDVIHAVEESVFLALPFTWLGVPLVYDLDSLLSEQLAYSGAIRSRWILRLVRGLERLALARAAAAITVCRSISEAVRRERSDVAVFQVEDAPLDEAARDPRPERVAALRRSLGLEGRRCVVYTGNFEGYQGLELVLAALPRLRERAPDAALVLVGGEAAEVEAVRGRAERDGFGPALRAVGRRPAHEMPEWMALGSALVSARSRGENTPLKIYTYMRSGTPIVATRRPTHTQVLDDETAFLCEPTPEGLADGLAAALGDPGRARIRAIRARERSHREFGADAFARKLLAAYASLPPRRAAPRAR
jgi:glycosyltransferase involved in cell wall biosynthesis